MTTLVELIATDYRADAEPAWERAQAWISGVGEPDAGAVLDRWLVALDLRGRAGS